MSHIIFGDFNSNNLNEEVVKDLKKQFLTQGILFHFNNEIDFYNDVPKMIKENSSTNNITLCITSVNQVFNSDELLFPYDKYEDYELFPDGEDRSQFERICFQNLMVLKKSILQMQQLLETQNLRILIAGGYDDEFETVICNVDQMFQDIIFQVINSFNLKSKIYEIS